jgi:predicted acetyltransferase
LANIEVLPAALEQMPVIANLLELYAYDFSEFLDLELADDGKFGYPNLSRYWREPDRHPFLIWADRRLAGFVLVQKGPELSANQAVWDIAEFFVVRGYRMRGIGTHVAHEVWRRFPGPWVVRVMQSNNPARQFWERAITAFTGEPVNSSCVERNGKSWILFSFISKANEPQ